jgi:hypothetical protein
VIVKGKMIYDPAEVVKDFVVKRFKLFPGGVFWYNCSSHEMLEASVKSILPQLKTIRKEPPKQTKAMNKKRSFDSSPLFEEHYQLIILDSPYNFEECVKAIPDIHDQQVDIIIIGKVIKPKAFPTSALKESLRVDGLGSSVMIQRMAYRLVCKQDLHPCKETYEAFEKMSMFCEGDVNLAKSFERLLTSNDEKIVPKIVGHIKVPRTKDSMSSFLCSQLTNQSYTLLQILSYISRRQPKVVLVFPESFVCKAAGLVASARGITCASNEPVTELKRKNLLRLYPQPVLYPLKKTLHDDNLLYIPSSIMVEITMMTECDMEPILHMLSEAQQLKQYGVDYFKKI